MARIGKAEHARILHLADVDGRRVADIAAEYGCSAANIYALLGKLRRAAPVQSAVARPETLPPPAPPAVATPETGVVDLFAVTPKATALGTRTASPAASSEPAAGPKPRSAPRATAPGKPGYGLVMRSAEGEDSLAPFRSLEDLLGAIKPILRAAATSAEPVWFCIQPVDLATLEDDAA